MSLSKFLTESRFTASDFPDFPLRKYFLQNIVDMAKMRNHLINKALRKPADFIRNPEIYSRTTIPPIVVRL